MFKFRESVLESPTKFPLKNVRILSVLHWSRQEADLLTWSSVTRFTHYENTQVCQITPHSSYWKVLCSKISYLNIGRVSLERKKTFISYKVKMYLVTSNFYENDALNVYKYDLFYQKCLWALLFVIYESLVRYSRSKCFHSILLMYQWEADDIFLFFNLMLNYYELRKISTSSGVQKFYITAHTNHKLVL